MNVGEGLSPRESHQLPTPASVDASAGVLESCDHPNRVIPLPIVI